jgi:DNA invertase Pin-like site-specific DNA recombinase
MSNVPIAERIEAELRGFQVEKNRPALDRRRRYGAKFKSLADAWADSTTVHGKLLITLLGGLAEFERELIRARTSSGRERARARSVHMVRPSKLTPPGGEKRLSVTSAH